MSLRVTLSGERWGLPAPTCLGEPLETLRVASASPADLLDLLARLDEIAASGDPDLLAAGYLTYEAGVALEGSLDLFRPPEVPLAVFGVFRLSRSRGGGMPSRHTLVTSAGETSDFAEWAAGVQTIRQAIARGDVYQVNLTRRLRLRGRVDPFALGAALAAENPVPLAITVAEDDVAVVSNSPELFLEVDLARRHAASAPIKGTIARGRTRDEDRTARRRLLASTKDAAEHVMIVDLVRNDLGRVARPGGVSVPLFRTLRTFRHLHHLESTVAAHLAPETRLSDVLRATLPAGSITGAPKRAALRVIRALEPCPRGAYTGAAGYVRGDGRAVFNVAIRTAITIGDKVDYHAGGGIVWDSDPAAEWSETETKSREFGAALDALAERSHGAADQEALQ